MNILKDISFDLGLSRLVPEWKKFFTTHYLINDISAGLTVACVAIPLSLAIALASGVSPGVGLITAIIAGIICALFGGTPLAVSGPAAAMSILIANSVEKFGITGLIFMCFLIGILQLVSGVFRLGKLTRFVPLPVIAAFTSGIGVIILIGQLPRVFGLPQPDQSRTIDVLSHLLQYFHQIKPIVFILVIITITIIRILPKFFPRIPAALVAVVIVTLLALLFPHGNIPVIGEIPQSLPTPHLPSFPNIAMSELLLATFTIYLLACLETLLSSSAVDKLVKNSRHDPNQELIGQGLGNIAVSLFGGIPVTSVIARSAVNIQSGAETRRASIIHSIALLFAVYVAAPLISMIPIAALAGVLISVALSMINYQELVNLWNTSRSEAIIYIITFFTIIFVDLVAGVQVGILAACLILLLRTAKKTSLRISSHFQDVIRLSLKGALTFLTTNKISELDRELQNVDPNKTIILDLSRLSDLDSSGAATIIDLVNNFRAKNHIFYIKGLPTRFETLFKACNGEEVLEKYYLVSESELKNEKGKSRIKSFHGRLIHGVHRYYEEQEEKDDRLLKHIALKQDPHTLFITCSDSRIITSMLTSADPGELFIIRNVGNFIPPHCSEGYYSEIAALEFALTQLDITDVVVCGHSSCGAINACYHKGKKLPPQLQAWIERIRSGLNFHTTDLTELSQQNVMNQIKNLLSHPFVRKKVESNKLALHGWFFDFEKRLVFEWDNNEMKFKAITENLENETVQGNGKVLAGVKAN